MSKSRDAFRTISEVAEWLETPAHVLRFWESKFPQVKPVKRAGGRRYYRPADMELLGGIKTLLHDEGMTIKGVQKVLREQGVRHVAALSGETVETGAGQAEQYDDIDEAPFEEMAESQGTVVPFAPVASSETAAPSAQAPVSDTGSVAGADTGTDTASDRITDETDAAPVAARAHEDDTATDGETAGETSDGDAATATATDQDDAPALRWTVAAPDLAPRLRQDTGRVTSGGPAQDRGVATTEAAAEGATGRAPGPEGAVTGDSTPAGSGDDPTVTEGPVTDDVRSGDTVAEDVVAAGSVADDFAQDDPAPNEAMTKEAPQDDVAADATTDAPQDLRRPLGADLPADPDGTHATQDAAVTPDTYPADRPDSTDGTAPQPETTQGFAADDTDSPLPDFLKEPLDPAASDRTPARDRSGATDQADTAQSMSDVPTEPAPETEDSTHDAASDGADRPGAQGAGRDMSSAPSDTGADLPATPGDQSAMPPDAGDTPSPSDRDVAAQSDTSAPPQGDADRPAQQGTGPTTLGDTGQHTHSGADALSSETPRGASALPDDPDLESIRVRPRCLGHLARITQLSPAQARAIAPLVARLRHAPGHADPR